MTDTSLTASDFSEDITWLTKNLTDGDWPSKEQERQLYH